MRTLFVARWAPWPPASGAQLRSANIVAALAQMGDVDVFLLADPRHSQELSPPAEMAVRRTGVVARHDADIRSRDRLQTFVPGSRPAIIRHLDAAAARAAFAEWRDGSYGVAWFVRLESWLALGDLVDAPAIVDFDDLRDQLVASRRRSPWPDPPSPRSVSARARDPVGRAYRTADARAWRRLQHQVAAAVTSVVVCSEPDQARLGVANAAVVPNTIEIPDRPVGRTEVGRPPTIVLHGSLTYDPNVDAATILVRDVLPRVRIDHPDVILRLVGRSDDRLARFAEPDRVVVTGAVPDIAAELERADVVALPLRQGAGTRIKLIEALAHRIPVVATTIAVDGLSVESGRHLLVADEPHAFADGCIALLHDVPLRRHLADEGERLVRASYRPDAAREAVIRLVEEATRARA
jgi:hypothetical protein